jgi:hypothetical protein
MSGVMPDDRLTMSAVMPDVGAIPLTLSLSKGEPRQSLTSSGKRRDKPARCSEGRTRTVKASEPHRPRVMGGLS